MGYIQLLFLNSLRMSQCEHKEKGFTYFCSRKLRVVVTIKRKASHIFQLGRHSKPLFGSKRQTMLVIFLANEMLSSTGLENVACSNTNKAERFLEDVPWDVLNVKERIISSSTQTHNLLYFTLPSSLFLKLVKKRR